MHRTSAATEQRHRECECEWLNKFVFCCTFLHLYSSGPRQQKVLRRSAEQLNSRKLHSQQLYRETTDCLPMPNVSCASGHFTFPFVCKSSQSRCISISILASAKCYYAICMLITWNHFSFSRQRRQTKVYGNLKKRNTKRDKKEEKQGNYALMLMRGSRYTFIVIAISHRRLRCDESWIHLMESNKLE